MPSDYAIPRGQLPGGPPGQQTLPTLGPQGQQPDQHLPRSYGPETDEQFSGPSYVEQLRQQRQEVMDRIKNNEAYEPDLPSKQDLIMPKPEPLFRQPRPAPPRQQLRLFDITAPPGGQPLPPQNPVSVPGGRPPNPANPVGIPGALSRVYAVHVADFIRFAEDDFAQWAQDLLSRGQTPMVRVITRGVMLEARGGKVPLPGAQPVGTTPDGRPRYRWQDLGWNEQEQRRVNADEEPNGAPEQRGVHGEVPVNSRAEVIEVSPYTNEAMIIVPLSSGRLEPHLLQGWVEIGDLRPEPGAATPFIGR